jgi:hypothetical protein
MSTYPVYSEKGQGKKDPVFKLWYLKYILKA